MENIMSIYEEYKTKKKEYKFFLSANVRAIFEDILRIYKLANPNCTKLVIQGYTPSFNDGDPCRHYSDTYVGNFGELFEVTDFDRDVIEFLKIPDEFTDDGMFDECMEFLEEMEEDCTRDYELFGDLENLAEELWGTNFHILVKFENDTIDINKIYYHCGH